MSIELDGIDNDDGNVDPTIQLPISLRTLSVTSRASPFISLLHESIWKNDPDDPNEAGPLVDEENFTVHFSSLDG